ncbi:MAG TPA: aminodeoxychorismate lyase [Gammaproteobacteria bacterium]|nr:aminodeoxychorismate lyase [Gammaproteobacteria bacterium]
MFLINGEVSDCLPVTDRGLQYGDGIFETLAVERKKPLCWNQHYQRLVRGCRRLDIAPPAEDQLLWESGRLLVKDQAAVLKMIITRGEGGRGYRPPVPAPSPTRILALYPWPDYPAQNVADGIKVRFCETRLGRNPLLAGIKHLNRLEQILARNKWQDESIAEGLMLDTGDCVIAGTMSNLFIARNDSLLTPSLELCGIEGIVRQAILDKAEKLSLTCHIGTLTMDDLQAADALFVTNSIFGVWPVRQAGEQVFSDHAIAHRIRQALINDRIILP